MRLRSEPRSSCSKPDTASNGHSIPHAHSQPSFSKWRSHSLLRTPSLPSLVATRTRDQVPLLFREKNVWRGFRAPHQPWGYYALSFFQLHNESVNVWSHTLACALMCWRVYAEWGSLWAAGAWPFLAGVSCTVVLYVVSALAHCFQSRSSLTHYTCFLIDYATVGLYSFGSALLHSEYSNGSAPRSALYLPLAATLAVAVCVCHAYGKTHYTRPYPVQRCLLQALPVVAAYALLITPLAPRLLAGGPAARLHWRHVVWFCAAAAAYICDLPQRWLPGWCDHFFHSHQLFHIFIMLSSLTQTDAVLADFHARGDRGLRPAPGVIESFAPVLGVISIQACFIVWFRRYVKTRLAREEALASGHPDKIED